MARARIAASFGSVDGGLARRCTSKRANEHTLLHPSRRCAHIWTHRKNVIYTRSRAGVLCWLGSVHLRTCAQRWLRTQITGAQTFESVRSHSLNAPVFPLAADPASPIASTPQRAGGKIARAAAPRECVVRVFVISTFRRWSFCTIQTTSPHTLPAQHTPLLQPPPPRWLACLR